MTFNDVSSLVLYLFRVSQGLCRGLCRPFLLTAPLDMMICSRIDQVSLLNFASIANGMDPIPQRDYSHTMRLDSLNADSGGRQPVLSQKDTIQEILGN